MEKEYTVLKIVEAVRVSDIEGVEKYYRHEIRTKGGTRLSVDISKEDFTPEKSAPILLAAARNADAILKL